LDFRSEPNYKAGAARGVACGGISGALQSKICCQPEAITSCPAEAERIQQAGFLEGQSSEKRNPEFIFLHCPVFNSTPHKGRKRAALLSLLRSWIVFRPRPF
jgi:hypothetical protein